MSLIILKPEALDFGKVGEILAVFERKGYRLACIKNVLATPDKVVQHYKEHEGKDFYDNLYKQFVNKQVIAIIIDHPVMLNRTSMISAIRTLVGKVDQPGSIRGDFARTPLLNMIHASDSIESAEREISIWFGNQ